MTPIPFTVLAQQWHPTRNTEPLTEDIPAGSHKKFWWLGDCGHEWETFYYSRALLGTGCPVCVKRLAPANKSLSTVRPDVAALWDVERNGSGPESVTARSHRKAFFSWECGHFVQIAVSSMTSRKSLDCLKCAPVKHRRVGKPAPRLVPVVVFEQFTQECHLSLEELETVTPTSTRVAQFTCSGGHSWTAQIRSRFTRDKVTGVYLFKTCRLCSASNVLANQSWFKPETWSLNNKVTPEQVTTGSGKKYLWVCEKGHEWNKTISEYQKFSLCPICMNKKILPGYNDLQTLYPELVQREYSSKDAGEELVAFVRGLGLEVEENVRSLIAPQEVDVYVPALNIAFEFNGLYWHSEEQGKGRRYHYGKWLACREQGVQLFTVWEDDWVMKPDIVKQWIADKLGVNQSVKVFARKTRIVEVDSFTAEQFLNEYHIQGAVRGSVRYGLQYGDQLVALLVGQRSGERVTIVRYCTSGKVVGGFTKLLKRVTGVPGISEVVTFSDNCYSSGGLYEAAGFVRDGVIPPDYSYVDPVSRVRVHKFNFRVGRFKSRPGLKFVEGLSERELAELNGLARVWDCGKVRWKFFV